MSVKMLDLKAEFVEVEADVRSAIDRVFESQRFILGPEVEALEREVAHYCGAKHGVGVSSGSDALLVSLMALGVGPGDEVVTTPYTFFATAGAIARLGARPVFADIEYETCNIDPNMLEKAVTEKTRAIIPVHLYGRCADMQAIMEIADSRNIKVIEDAAQAIGAETGGKRAGTFGHLGCFSFFPSKNLGALGDGGMVVTSDSDLADKVRILRTHGAKPKYYHAVIGGNFRLDAIHAAVLREKLKRLDSWTKRRQENAEHYDRLIRDAGLLDYIVPPAGREGIRHIFNQYVVRAKDRDRLKAYLDEKGIGNAIYYPVPLHLQECFAYLGYKEGDFPQSEKAARETLALPVYPFLEREQQQEVVDTIKEFYR